MPKIGISCTKRTDAYFYMSVSKADLTINASTILFNQNSDLMKKANFSLVLSSIVFLLFLGVSNLSAQTYASTLGLDAPFDDKVLNVDDVQFVDVTEATVILSDQIKLVGQNMPTTGNYQEALNTTKVLYYSYLLEQIANSNSIIDVLPNSGGELLQYIGRFKANLGLDAEEIYLQVVALLEQ